MSDTVFVADSRHGTNEDALNQIREAAKAVASWPIVPRAKTRSGFYSRTGHVEEQLRSFEGFVDAPQIAVLTEEERGSCLYTALLDLRTNSRLIAAAIKKALGKRDEADRLPRVAIPGKEDEPRIAAISREYLRAAGGVCSPSSLVEFIQILQASDALTLHELWNVGDFLKYALAESLLAVVSELRKMPEKTEPEALVEQIKCLRELNHVDWPKLIEPLILFDEILRQDPADAYAQMDFMSRERYRERVARIAQRSDCSEVQVAQRALTLARVAAGKAVGDPRLHKRMAHIGYYIVDKGFPQLAQRVGYHAPLSWRLRRFVLDHPEDFYITGIQLVTLFVISAALFPVLHRISSFFALSFALIVLFFPAMQIAVDLINSLVTSFFDPSPLPKLDFTKAIPAEYATLVAVPSLLLNEKQVRELVYELEVRYVANRDPNLHFALVTDLQDSVSKPRENDGDPLVELAVQLISDLNARYHSRKSGTFMLLHRHRTFNTRQGVWMGWERKRGKLLDLNKLLMGTFDAFPIKTGGYESLQGVRYVITLDSDSQLPRGAAARLIGAIAHPLNQAIIDPKLRIVVEGYGILQPRIGVTVSSAIRSRFASIYSGSNGFDVYARAISDVYQDLFGEGSYTGKGIYEVKTLHAVLDRRFPRNALLSHDLIEGAYARAGLASDIELVDDYPSHYSAYSRRQHRWFRGDWQIGQWVFSRVPDEVGKWVRNPISDISRWKIFDNLRRSLVEPFLLLLFVAGWLGLPGGPAYWTIVPLLMLFFPAVVQGVVGVGRSLVRFRAKGALEALSAASGTARLALLHLVFLGQQALLAFDAVIRSLIRSIITGERLLEWETAAQAERRTTGSGGIDRYLIITPFLSIAIAALIVLLASNKIAILWAAPILFLWAVANPVAMWLEHPPRERQKLALHDVEFLIRHALRVWRYFCEFGVERHNYLIPDNVTEDDHAEASRISPTNIGLLLNARQAACEFGFITVPEFADLTGKTLATLARLQKYRGHLYNWYETDTLRMLKGHDDSAFISTVDSGNFVASLYTLHAGAKSLLNRPLVDSRIFAGLRAYWNTSYAECKVTASMTESRPPKVSESMDEWHKWLTSMSKSVSASIEASFDVPEKVWWLEEMLRRINAILSLITDFTPWILPEYEPLHLMLDLKDRTKRESLSFAETPQFAKALESRLVKILQGTELDSPTRSLCERLRADLRKAEREVQGLVDRVSAISDHARMLADGTDFAFLIDSRSEILAIGYDATSECLMQSHYDLLASEARVASYLTIARGDLPQESWFRLSRDHALAFGQHVMLSWTGTMFEYLMPAIWMRSYPDTLLSRNLRAAIVVQMAFAKLQGIPWGISESGHGERNEAGHYGYHAFGIPQMAIFSEATAGPVVSPYSTFLALNIEPDEALKNLRWMENEGWCGQYGFYEAIDFRQSVGRPETIREWMVHHQGMSLLAILNLLSNNVVQEWFHDNAMVQSAERLLYEP